MARVVRGRRTRGPDPTVAQRRQAAAAASDAASVAGTEGEPPEEDFPEIELDELLDEMTLADADAPPDDADGEADAGDGVGAMDADAPDAGMA